MIEFGYKQTPIDLKSNLPVETDFQDTGFHFNYDKIDKSGSQLKYHETNE